MHSSILKQAWQFLISSITTVSALRTALMSCRTRYQSTFKSVSECQHCYEVSVSPSHLLVDFRGFRRSSLDPAGSGSHVVDQVPVWWLVPPFDQAEVGSVISVRADVIILIRGTQSEKTPRKQPCGTPILTVSSAETFSPILATCGLDVLFQVQVQVDVGLPV